MNTFRTNYQAKKASKQISYQDETFFLGSCFSNNISQYLAFRKFKVKSNPYGILFNPISIFQAIEEIIDLKKYSLDDLVEHNELFHSLKHHSDFSGTNGEEVLNKINQNIFEGRTFLKNSSHLFLTFGTAWVYEYQGEIVANCHKIPNHQFQKRLLHPNEISNAFIALKDKLSAFNPNLQIVYTVSPVRHLKDGFEENALSKAILRTAIHQIQQENDAIAYFPSYEIMMDDLRDYRFYEKDLLHPNSTAVDYIWEQFKTRYVAEDALAVMTRIENLQTALHHRPKFESTEEHQKLLAFIKREQEALKSFFPE